MGTDAILIVEYFISPDLRLYSPSIEINYWLFDIILIYTNKHLYEVKCKSIGLFQAIIMDNIIRYLWNSNGDFGKILLNLGLIYTYTIRRSIGGNEIITR